ACWNSSHIEIGAADGMGSPCGLLVPGTRRHSGSGDFPLDEGVMVGGFAVHRRAAKLRKSRRPPPAGTDSPAKVSKLGRRPRTPAQQGLLTLVRISALPQRSKGEWK